MTLDRPDWKCRVGDSAVFRVTLLRGGHELPRAKVSVALAQERRRRTVAYGVIRAGDFLFSLPQFDGTNYVVQGGSQGGHLALVAGALDARVKAVSASYPAMSDHLGYLRARAGGWPHIFADTTKLRAIAEKKEKRNCWLSWRWAISVRRRKRERWMRGCWTNLVCQRASNSVRDGRSRRARVRNRHRAVAPAIRPA